MIILPLYYEPQQGKGAVDTRLLLLAHGTGAAIAMRTNGRLTDRFGGGITSVADLIITMATTNPFVSSAATPACSPSSSYCSSAPLAAALWLTLELIRDRC